MTQSIRRDQRCKTPPVPTGTWAQVKGNIGGQTDEGHGSRIRHAAQGAEMSSGHWQVEGRGEV